MNEKIKIKVNGTNVLSTKVINGGRIVKERFIPSEYIMKRDQIKEIIGEDEKILLTEKSHIFIELSLDELNKITVKNIESEEE